MSEDFKNEEKAMKPMFWEDGLSRIIWKNDQWAVTDFGLENIAGPYHYFIKRHTLKQLDWPKHMMGKNWVIDDLFVEAYEKALQTHKEATP